MLDKTGKESHFVNGLRYTDEETMEVVQMVLAGKTNKDLVSLINQKGARAVGISGMDAHIIEAVPYQAKGADLGYVGAISKVDGSLILDVLDKGYIPVVASVGCLYMDSLCSHHAENMILVSDIPGVLKDPNDEASLISCIYLDDIPYLQQSGVISGGMIPKVECCANALHGSVAKAVIIDGRVPHSILIEMFSKDGAGTMFQRKEV